MTSSSPSYLIIGAGVFGVSTAYTLIQKYPNAFVTLVDRDAYDAESRVAASWDWNKVIRADYDDKVYCRLALEAQEIFKSDPLWQPHFHQTGVYWTCRSDYAQDVIANHKELGRNDEIIALPVAEARKLYGGIFDNADYTGVKEVLVNRASGWAAAGDALRAVTKRCVELGVSYVTASVTNLEFDGRGSCTGVKTQSGEILSATHVLVATGAFTPTLLEWSAAKSGNAGLRAGERILAAGITTGMAQLNEEQYEKFKEMPVGFQGYTPNEGKPFIGTLPPTKDRELKWWGSKIFTNTREWTVPGPLQQDIVEARNLWYGPESATWEMTKHRICWDAFTTTSDFIISPHSASKGLYIATCGSFHGFKFFPVLGKYITQMLEGELAPELMEKWAWDRQRPDSSENVEFPNCEMKHLLEPAAKL
ncbi:Sarcosine oxidase [Penicillium digitatum]|uniref:Sarcosine oxidase n=1 Tax=Penicillium digitatum TaxID=36651 RepID=A0A7T6XFM3_PENDI|nr:Sarcosine oxidase [Penicillium digitatum]